MSNLSDVMTLPLQIPETIPNDWSWRNLVELCNPKQWKTISNSDLTETGYRVFGANGFIGYYHEFNHEDETISVTCRGATCGTVNLIPPRTYITGNSMCLDNLSREVSKFYLFYATQFRTFSDVISGSAQPQITGEGLKKVSLPIPPLPEQKKIASILTSVDEVIENTQKKIDKLQDLKKATMNELLTKGIGHTEFKDSELGRIPKSWEVYELGKLCAFTQGVQISLDETLRIEREGYIRYLYINDFSSEKNLRFIKDEFPAKIVKNEDLVMANTGHSAGTIFRGKHGILSNNAFKISIKKYIKSEYLFHFLSTDNYWFNIGKLFNTAGQPHVGHGNIAKLHFLCPPLDEQDKINSIIQKIDQNILNKNIKLSQIQSLKKSLMQDLLSGKVRVTVN